MGRRIFQQNCLIIHLLVVFKPPADLEEFEEDL